MFKGKVNNDTFIILEQILDSCTLQKLCIEEKHYFVP